MSFLPKTSIWFHFLKNFDSLGIIWFRSQVVCVDAYRPQIPSRWEGDKVMNSQKDNYSNLGVGAKSHIDKTHQYIISNHWSQNVHNNEEICVKRKLVEHTCCYYLWSIIAIGALVNFPVSDFFIFLYFPKWGIWYFCISSNEVFECLISTGDVWPR